MRFRRLSPYCFRRTARRIKPSASRWARFWRRVLCRCRGSQRRFVVQSAAKRATRPAERDRRPRPGADRAPTDRQRRQRGSANRARRRPGATPACCSAAAVRAAMAGPAAGSPPRPAVPAAMAATLASSSPAAEPEGTVEWLPVRARPVGTAATPPCSATAGSVGPAQAANPAPAEAAGKPGLCSGSAEPVAPGVFAGSTGGAGRGRRQRRAGRHRRQWWQRRNRPDRR